MLKKMKTLIAVAVLSGSVSANVQAATITNKQEDTRWDQYNLTLEKIQKNGDTLETDIPVNPAAPAVSEPFPVSAKPIIAHAKKKSASPIKLTSSTRSKETKKVKETKEITVKATAYTASCEGCSGITKTGINIKDNPEKKVIAVDPSVIPLGSKVYVEGFGEAIAADTGGAIKGKRIDIFIPSERDALDFGVKKLKVTILN
ncbi:3D (Asp-Asp-Asp) domain-containing protein [Neobacillus drentensis]|uniref:3D domain-containing protein n=1 Tax=Neobacillus drentensis TaxID=220684 RepID=UPI00285B8030|nr:3D domain-containing protein [Neobacillus drentensis]MDR7239042.1 3D (Asp-Asp-Asp) domain-containing protein [Neobacillus drentensis]